MSDTTTRATIEATAQKSFILERLFNEFLTIKTATALFKATIILISLAFATLSTHGEFLYEKTVEANKAAFEFETKSNVEISTIKSEGDCRKLPAHKTECLEARDLKASVQVVTDLFYNFFDVFVLLAKLCALLTTIAVVGWLFWDNSAEKQKST